VRAFKDIPAPTVEEIDEHIADLFTGGRTVRSEQYKKGMRSIYVHYYLGTPLETIPYVIGTCEADAYFAGQTEAKTHGKPQFGGAS
jgi:hypothetical protein